MARAEKKLAGLEARIHAMEEQFHKEVEVLRAKYGEGAVEPEPVELRPRKSDIAVDRVVMVWLPWWVDGDGLVKPAY